LNVKINPKVLEWARREAGYTIDEIANRIDIEPERYSKWETTSNNDIPLAKLKEISNQFKRQLAVFFLSKVPPSTQKPSDFRNLRLSSAGLSKETLLAIRRAHKYLDLSADMMGKDFWESKYTWMREAHSPEQLRTRLDITIADQQSFKYTSEAFKTWRNRIESILGILVFQFSLPLEEVQAFCMADTLPFCIVLNSRHHYTARIFSLFHELAHIAQASSGICYPDDLDVNQSFEFSCNNFAGKLLIPDDVVPLATTIKELTYHANILKVSREVILRRNLERSFISRELFFELLAEVRKLPKLKKVGGAASTIEKAQTSRGQLFYNIVLQAVKGNKLDYNTASDALGVKLNYLMYV
jgi:Zn-dependent peptidase ImmA (M78 family)